MKLRELARLEPGTPPPRFFDPRWLGTWEQRAWAGYYLRDWPAVLAAAVGMVRCGFGMSWPRTLQGAWYVLRANQLWAPFPDNDRAGAERYMAKFYSLLSRVSGELLDTAEAARLEVEWWRAHREAQRGDEAQRAASQLELVDALAALYAFTYGAGAAEVRPAAQLRADAMEVSDRWVAEGCDRQSDLLQHERALLIRSYAALLAAVHR